VICDPCARVRPGVSRVCPLVCPGSPTVSRSVKRQRGAVGSRDTKKTQEAGSKTPGQLCGFEQVLQFDTRSQLGDVYQSFEWLPFIRKFRGHNFDSCVTNFDEISVFLFAPAMANFVDFTATSEFVTAVSNLQNPPHALTTQRGA